jgi:hypothetical protein
MSTTGEYVEAGAASVTVEFEAGVLQDDNAMAMNESKITLRTVFIPSLRLIYIEAACLSMS